MIRFHYSLWAILAISFIVFGMLYSGQQDLIVRQAKAEGKEEGKVEGAAMFLKDMTPKQLAELKI